MARITRMDDWDRTGAYRSRHARRCDMRFRPALHRKGGMYFITLYRRSGEGPSFEEIKSSEEHAETFSKDSARFLSSYIGDLEGWAVVTTPRRRHFGGFHFATEVCRMLAKAESIPFYEGAVQCINRDRISPEFHLLRPVAEERIIIFDDIITTGRTLEATYALLKEDRRQVVCIVGINNR